MKLNFRDTVEPLHAMSLPAQAQGRKNTGLSILCQKVTIQVEFGNAMNKVHPRPKIQSIGNPLKDIVSTRMSLRKYRGILRFF